MSIEITQDLQKVLDTAAAMEEVVSVQATEVPAHLLSQVEAGEYIYLDYVIKVESDEEVEVGFVVPTKIIDSLEPEMVNHFPPFNRKNVPLFKNEWQYYDYFKEKNIKFFNENKLEIIKGLELKIKFLLFNIYNYGSTEHLNEGKIEILISHVLNRIVFLFSLLIFSLKIMKKKILKEDVYFITIIITSLMPLVIGWITSKHLVPIFIICHIYSLLNAYRIIYKKF
jgi:hypothetical protein